MPTTTMRYLPLGDGRDREEFEGEAEWSAELDSVVLQLDSPQPADGRQYTVYRSPRDAITVGAVVPNDWVGRRVRVTVELLPARKDGGR